MDACRYASCPNSPLLHLGGTNSRVTFPDIMLAAHFFVFGLDGFVPGQLEGVSICKGALLIDHQELTTIRGPSINWVCAATSSDKFVSRERFRYLRSPSDQCPRWT